MANYDVVREAQALRRVIGLSGQYAAVDENLTGRENLVLFGRLYQLGPREAQQRAEALLVEFDLVEAAGRVTKGYSGGMRRRLDLACALIGQPRVLFLDEPTTGLDPRSRLALWEVIRRQVRDGATVLLTTQYLEEADALASRIAVVDRGKVIASGTSDELKARVGGERIEVVINDRAQLDDAARVLGVALAAAVDGVPVDPASIAVQRDDAHRRLSGPARGGAARLVHVLRELDGAGIRLDDVALRRPTLDDVFLALTGHDASAPVAGEPSAATAAGGAA